MAIVTRARIRAGAVASVLAKAIAESPATQLISAIEVIWRCGQCGYQRWSSNRPGACPECAAEAECFTGMTAVEWRQVPAPVPVKQAPGYPQAKPRA